MGGAGFNIEATDFVGDNGFLLIQRSNMFYRADIFIMTCGGLDLRRFHFFGLDKDPSRRADLLDMEEPEKGWDIAFIEFEFGIGFFKNEWFG